MIAEKNTRKCYKKCVFLLNRTDFNMAQQFVETIKIVNGKTQALAYHQERMERTICKFFPSLCNASMPSLEKLINPTESMDFYKARVVYGKQGVEAVEYAPYFIRNINSLQVVEDDTITRMATKVPTAVASMPWSHRKETVTTSSSSNMDF